MTPPKIETSYNGLPRVRYADRYFTPAAARTMAAELRAHADMLGPLADEVDRLEAERAAAREIELTAALAAHPGRRRFGDGVYTLSSFPSRWIRVAGDHANIPEADEPINWIIPASARTAHAFRGLAPTALCDVYRNGGTRPEKGKRCPECAKLVAELTPTETP